MLRAIRVLEWSSRDKAAAIMDNNISIHKTAIRAMPSSRLSLIASACLLLHFAPNGANERLLTQVARSAPNDE
jgi:hypothetical protein